MDFATWDDRIEKFRIPAHQYRALVETLRKEHVTFTDQVSQFEALSLKLQTAWQPYPHQQEGLDAWIAGGWRGVVVLPTAAGKTYLAYLAMQATPRRRRSCEL